VCVARAEDGGAPRLLAGAVGDAADAALPGALREHLRGVLPEYMVPAAIGVVAALPLTPNGKIDAAALPTPDAARAEAAEHVAPRTETERVLAGIIAGLVRAERVGVHDNFFDLGGDSILAMELVGQARDAGLELSTRLVFVHQTVAGMAEHAGEAKAQSWDDGTGAALDAGEMSELLYAMGLEDNA
jgi:aryl carrier-like protein